MYLRHALLQIRKKHDWALVNNDQQPNTKILNIQSNDLDIHAVLGSCSTFWEWPVREYSIQFVFGDLSFLRTSLLGDVIRS